MNMYQLLFMNMVSLASLLLGSYAIGCRVEEIGVPLLICGALSFAMLIVYDIYIIFNYLGTL